MDMLKTIDWALLRSQKLTLLQAIDAGPPTVAEDLQGILHLIDALQDAPSQHLGDGAVFDE